MPPHPSTTTSGDLTALVMDHSLTILAETGLRYLHNVNTRLWDLSFQPTTAATQPSMRIPFSQSCSTSQPIVSPHPWTQQATGTTESPNERTKLYGYGFAPVPEGETPAPSPSRPPEQSISKGRVHKSRGFLCPKCRSYTSNRSFNIKRHQKACQKKLKSGVARGKDHRCLDKQTKAEREKGQSIVSWSFY